MPLEELRGFPALLLPELPFEVRILVQARGIASEVVLGGATPGDPIGFNGAELRALAVGAQAERVWPADFRGYCLHKRQDPSFHVTEALVLAGAQPEAGPAWSLARVLDWLDLEQVGFEWTPLGQAPEPAGTSQPGSLGAAA